MSRSKASRQRSAANTAETTTMTVNERILKECHELYVAEDKGLIALSKAIGLTLLPPRRKITVLLIGNHSAGKSSFINWYIEETVQRTAVAIETQGFTLITSGRRRESLTGNATLHLFPQFRELQDIDGVVDYLSTEIATSKQKKFSFVTFIDSPGLVDGDMSYPFDVETTLEWIGQRADLVLVFFDPLGQALCRKTLDIVERLNAEHPERIKFYLSKADTVATQGDRQRVLMQITQELCKRPGLNKAGFDMPTIYIPTLTEKTYVQCDNNLEWVCQEIEKTINRNIQSTLNKLEKDGEAISAKLKEDLQNNEKVLAQNSRARYKSFLLYMLGLIIPVLYSFVVLSNINSPHRDIPIQLLVIVSGIVLTLSVVILVIGRRLHRIQPTVSRKQQGIMKDNLAYLEGFIKDKKSTLYGDYLKQSVASLDMS